MIGGNYVIGCPLVTVAGGRVSTDCTHGNIAKVNDWGIVRGAPVRGWWVLVPTETP